MATREQKHPKGPRFVGDGKNNCPNTRRTGKSKFGRWLWTPKEDRLIREMYPDFSALEKLLRRRSIPAIKNRAFVLRLLRRPCHTWTAAEVLRLRRLWPRASRQELLAEFAPRTWKSLAGMAYRLRLRRQPLPVRLTGNSILDDIRRRAASLNISLKELDRICSTGAYFKHSCDGRAPGRNAWPKAVAALGGKLQIVWQ